jgi:hypothetical protein
MCYELSLFSVWLYAACLLHLLCDNVKQRSLATHFCVDNGGSVMIKFTGSLKRRWKVYKETLSKKSESIHRKGGITGLKRSRKQNPPLAD